MQLEKVGVGGGGREGGKTSLREAKSSATPYIKCNSTRIKL